LKNHEWLATSFCKNQTSRSPMWRRKSYQYRLVLGSGLGGGASQPQAGVAWASQKAGRGVVLELRRHWGPDGRQN
jgi:hypothetical protein